MSLAVDVLALRPELTTEQQRRALALLIVHTLFPTAQPSVCWQLARWIQAGAVPP